MRHKKEIILNDTKVYLFERSVSDLRNIDTVFAVNRDENGLIKSENMYEYLMYVLKSSLNYNLFEYDLTEKFWMGLYNRIFKFKNYKIIKKAISVKTLDKLTKKELTDIYVDLSILENYKNDDSDSDSDKKKAV